MSRSTSVRGGCALLGFAASWEAAQAGRARSQKAPQTLRSDNKPRIALCDQGSSRSSVRERRADVRQRSHDAVRH